MAQGIDSITTPRLATYGQDSLDLKAGYALGTSIFGAVAESQSSPATSYGALVGNDGALHVTTERTGRSHYYYSLLAQSLVATPTDAIIIQGSATKSVHVKRIRISGAATAAGNIPFSIIRRSTAGTIGSAVLTAIVAAKRATANAAATAVVSIVGTANVTTPGTSAGVVFSSRLEMTALATGVAAVFTDVPFASNNEGALLLAGTGEYLVVNFNGAAIPAGGVFDFTIETEEF